MKGLAGERQPDLLRIVEAIHQWTECDQDWLDGIAADAFEELQVGSGGGTAYYDMTSGGFCIRAGSFKNVPSDLLKSGFFLDEVTPEFVHSVGARPFSIVGDSPAWRDLPFVRDGRLHRFDIRDWYGMNGMHGDGTGCALVIFSPLLVQAGQGERHLFSRIAAQLGKASRLRRVLATRRGLEGWYGVDAILSADGRMQWASGKASTRAAQAEIREAVKTMDGARGRRRRQDIDRALTQWERANGGRWMLLEHFERDGRRFIMAVERHPASALEMLSAREREVLELAARGSSTKEIAFTLSLSDSTVRVLIVRAGRKLGSRSRAELVDSFRRLVESQNQRRQ